MDADPKSKLGWNELGLAYLDSSQEELAITAFQKQIEVNPYHDRSYNNLGQAYLRQRKYEEAIKSLKKQIELDPLHKYAHTNLGIAYLEQHKYAEAVPELEQAAALTSDNAESQVRLGEAYLNLGQDEKAMGAFSKAVKISARPMVLNNIAYQLTLKKRTWTLPGATRNPPSLRLRRNYATSRSITSTPEILVRPPRLPTAGTLWVGWNLPRAIWTRLKNTSWPPGN